MTAVGLANAAQVAAVDAKVDAQAYPVANDTALAAIPDGELSVGRIIQADDTGFRWTVLASGASVFDYQPGAVKFSVQGAAGNAVKPEQFGLFGDGVARNDEAEAMAAWGRRNGGLRVQLTQGQTYSYTNNRFLCGIPNFLIVDGPGSFQCLYESEGGAGSLNKDRECLVFPTAWYTLDNAGYPGGAFVSYGDESVVTADVDAGDTTFSVDTGEGAKFTEGERAIIYGFYIQTGGFPNPCRFFEYVTIADVIGDVITVTGPMLNSYKTNWRLTGSGPQWGPVRAISLSRSNYQETALMQFNNVHFKADPGWTNDRSGRVWIGNYGQAELNKCRGDSGMYIMQGQHFTDNGSSFAYDVELDKFIDSATFNAVDYASYSQGSGCKRVVWNDNNMRATLSVAAQERFEVNGGTILAKDQSAAMTDTNGCGQVVINGATLVTRSNNSSIFGQNRRSATFGNGGFNLITRYSKLTISYADYEASEIYRALRMGSVLTNKRGDPVFRVRVMPYDSGSQIELEGENLDGLLSFPLTLYLDGTTEIDARKLKQVGPKIIKNPVAVGFYDSWAGRFQAPHISDEKIVVTSRDFPEPNTSSSLFTIGYPMKITEIVFSVTKAYSGSTSNPLMKVEEVDVVGSTLPDILDFNLAATGTRTITAAGATGAASGDVGSSLPSSGITKFSLRSSKATDYSSVTDRAVWSLTIKGYQET